jgi:hypothetical protein
MRREEKMHCVGAGIIKHTKNLSLAPLSYFSRFSAAFFSQQKWSCSKFTIPFTAI